MTKANQTPAVDVNLPNDFVFPTVKELFELPDSEESFYQILAGGFDIVFCKTDKDVFICTIAARTPHIKLPNTCNYRELMSIQFKLEKQKDGSYMFARKDNDSDKIFRFEDFQSMLAVEVI